MTVVAPDEVISAPAPTTAQLTDVGGRHTSFSTLMVTGKQRRDATCGFVSGNLGFPVTCYTGASCEQFPDKSLVACCSNPDGRPCVPSTRCFDKTDSTRATDARDMICSDERAPLCKTAVMAGNPDIQGYSLFICDTDTLQETIMQGMSSSVTTSAGIWAPTTSGDGTRMESSSASEIPSPTSAGTIAGVVAGSVGGLIALIIGAILVGLYIKRRDKAVVSSFLPRGRHTGAAVSPPPEVEPASIPDEPIELPDSPTTATSLDRQSVVPFGPNMSMMPVSPVTVDGERH